MPLLQTTVIITETTDPQGFAAATEAGRNEAAANLGVAADEIRVIGTSNRSDMPNPDRSEPHVYSIHTTWAVKLAVSVQQ